MQMTIKKWGNSLATRIPKAVVDTIDLYLDQEVDIEVDNGRIIITPVKEKKEYTLKELLNQCKPGSLSFTDEDQAWLDDEPVGKEVW